MTVAAVASIAVGGISAVPASAINYVPMRSGDSWGIQDMSAPATDTGSVRDTKATAMRGFGGIRVHLVGADPVPRFDGELMRGFGLSYDGYDGFRSTSPVTLGPVRISRSIQLDRELGSGRWLDAFTNTSTSPITIQVSFGGTLGQNQGAGQSKVVASSSGDATITPADAWSVVATPSSASGAPTTNGPTAVVIGSPAPFAGAMLRTANALRDPFRNALPTTGEEANFYGYLSELTIAPGQTRSLLHYVVAGLSETRDAVAAGAVPAVGSQTTIVQTRAESLAAEPNLEGLSTGQICSITNWDPVTLGGPDSGTCAAVKTPMASPQPTPRTPVTGSPYDVVDKSVVQLQADMTAGRTTSEEITRAYLDRIAAYDVGPFGLHSYIYVNPEAITQARAADAARDAGASGALLGIPVSLKDLFDTNDMPTTAGTLVLEGYRSPGDAFQVAKLRAAGAVFLGKANLAELATGQAGSHSGWGSTWNAFQPSKTTMGSSGGSAVNVAASLSAFSMGTQSGGSLYTPATAASLYTMRTTDGMASVADVYPLFYLQDNAGPMVRTPMDLATALNVTTGTNAADPETAEADARRPADWRSALKANALEGVRIGYYAAAFNGANGEIGTRDAMLAQLGTLRAAGAEVTLMTAPPTAPTQPVSTDLDYVEGFLRWVEGHPNAPVKTVKALRESSRILPYNFRTDRSALPGFTPNQDAAFRQWRVDGKATYSAWMDQNQVDAVVYPGLTSDVYDGDANESNAPGSSPIPSSSTGLPSMVIPAGTNDHGQPVALQLLGRAWSDPQLLAYAYAFEQQADGRITPTTVPALRYEAGATTKPIVIEPAPVPVAPTTNGTLPTPGPEAPKAPADKPVTTVPLRVSSGSQVSRTTLRREGVLVTVKVAKPTTIRVQLTLRGGRIASASRRVDRAGTFRIRVRSGVLGDRRLATVPRGRFASLRLRTEAKLDGRARSVTRTVRVRG